jgi:hypothetical protein
MCFFTFLLDFNRNKAIPDLNFDFTASFNQFTAYIFSLFIILCHFGKFTFKNKL